MKARGPGLGRVCVCACVVRGVSGVGDHFILLAAWIPECPHPPSVSIGPRCLIMSPGPGPLRHTEWMFRMLDE